MPKFLLQADIVYSQLSKIERDVIDITICTGSALSEAMDIPAKEFFDFKLPGYPKK